MDFDLRKLQMTQLEILCEVKRVCKEQNISFFLYGGTLLGAIRHKGFIPWDDDLDIGMLRTDYERFIRVAPKMLKPKYVIQTWKNDQGYGWPFMKVHKRGTICKEIISADVNKISGIYIDIFPLDTFPDEEEKQKAQGKRIEYFRYLSLMKCGYKQWNVGGSRSVKKYIQYSPFRILTRFYSKDKIIEEYEKWATKYNSCPQYARLFPQSIRHYGTLAVPRLDFERTVPVLFENEEFPAPLGYENYLVSAYGDYMTPPPPDERANRHGLAIVDFGE